MKRASWRADSSLSRWSLVVVVLAGACSHGEPYAPARPAPDNAPVVEPSGIQRLTFGGDGDWSAGWLFDDVHVAFSWRVPERADGDRCLAFMAIPGYRIGDTMCVGGGPGGEDSTTVVTASAVSAGGRLALVVQSSLRNFGVAHRNLYVGRADGGPPAQPVLALPITAASGLLHGSMEQLVWRDESTLVYVATAPRALTTDLQSSPLEIGMVSLHGATAVPSVVPGTAGASSVAIDWTDAAAYATFVADSRVYRLDLASGQRQAVADLAAFGIPRDVRVVAGRLAAVVRGRVFPVPASAFGVATHIDEGGDLVFVDIGSPVAPTFYQKSFVWFRRIAISPDGQRLVAEGYPVAYPVTGPCCPAPEDTVVTKVSDLWLIPWP